MLGKILAITDSVGHQYIGLTTDLWRQQGFEIDETTVSDAMGMQDFAPYYLIAFCMSSENKKQFLNCMQILQMRTRTPIVMFDIEPSDPEFEIVALLEGADRVLFSPTSMEQTIANCISLIRRYIVDVGGADAAKPMEPITLDRSGLLISFDYGSVVIQGHEVRLTPREYELLRVFIAHKSQILSYRQIYRQVWDDNEIGFSVRMVSNLVSRLRAKLKTT